MTPLPSPALGMAYVAISRVKDEALVRISQNRDISVSQAGESEHDHLLKHRLLIQL